MSSTHYLVVIGAGIVGSFVAFEAAKRGLDVCLIERGRIGCEGATRFSGGNVRIYHTEPRLSDRAFRSLATWHELESAIGRDARFVRTGCLCLESSEREDAAREEVERLRHQGAAVDIVEHNQLHAHFGFLSFEGVSVGIYEPDAGYVEPVRVSQALGAAIQAMGGRIFENVEVKALVHTAAHNGWRVQTSLHEFCAERVVYAGGAGALDLIGPTSTKLELRTKGIRARHLHTPNGRGPLLSCAISDATTGLYGCPLPSGRTLLGLPTTDWDVASAHWSPLEPDPLFDKICRRRIPRSSYAEHEGGRYGVDVYRKGDLGLVARLDDGLIVATGWSGSGVKVAPSVAVDAVELLA
jgi:sarcosine oxidase, subunit beta